MSPSSSEQTGVQPEDFALYEFPEFSIYMDDVWYYHCMDGYIRWDCLGLEGDMAEVTITFAFNTPETFINNISGEEQRHTVSFLGKEYVEMAQAGDYSFIENTHILDEVTPDRVEIHINEAYDSYAVNFMGAVHVKEARTYLVDTRTQLMYDAEGNEAGIWTWWINPADYPLTGQTEFLFSKDLGGEEYVTVVNRIDSIHGIDLAAIDIEQAYCLHTTGEELLYLDTGIGQLPVMITNIHDFETGLMLINVNKMFYDDASRALMDQNVHIIFGMHEEGMPLQRCFVTEYQFKGKHDIPNYYERLSEVYVDPTPNEADPDDVEDTPENDSETGAKSVLYYYVAGAAAIVVVLAALIARRRK